MQSSFSSPRSVLSVPFDSTVVLSAAEGAELNMTGFDPIGKRRVNIDEGHNEVFVIPNIEESQKKILWYSKMDIARSRQEYQEEVMMDQVRNVAKKRLDEEGTPERLEEIMNLPPEQILAFLESPVKVRNSSSKKDTQTEPEQSIAENSVSVQATAPQPNETRLSEDDILEAFCFDEPIAETQSPTKSYNPTTSVPTECTVDNDESTPVASKESGTKSKAKMEKKNKAKLNKKEGNEKVKIREGGKSKSEPKSTKLEVGNSKSKSTLEVGKSKVQPMSSARDDCKSKSKPKSFACEDGKSKSVPKPRDDGKSNSKPKSPASEDGKSKCEPKSSTEVGESKSERKATVEIQASPVRKKSRDGDTRNMEVEKSRMDTERNSSRLCSPKNKAKILRSQLSPVARKFRLAVQTVQTSIAIDNFLSKNKIVKPAQMSEEETRMSFLVEMYIPSDDEDDDDTTECPICLGLVKPNQERQIILLRQLLCKNCFETNYLERPSIPNFELPFILGCT